MDQQILNDLFRYEGDSSRSIKVQLRYLFFTPGSTFIYFFRKSSKSRFFLWKILHLITMYIMGIQIPIGTKIGNGFRIVHFGAIVVNPNTIIGDTFNIVQGVLIGNSEGKRMGSPTIGNNLHIGANAIVIGGINIGNDVLMSPWAFVNFDVPNNSIVLGNSGQIIPLNSSPTTKYILNIILFNFYDNSFYANI